MDAADEEGVAWREAGTHAARNQRDARSARGSPAVADSVFSFLDLGRGHGAEALNRHQLLAARDANVCLCEEWLAICEAAHGYLSSQDHGLWADAANGLE